MKKLFRTLIFPFLLSLLLVSCGSKQKDESGNQDFEITGDEMKTNVTPKMTGIVTDNERLFKAEELTALLEKCKAFETKNSIPVAILTNANFGDFNSFTEFADAVSGKWDICKEEQGILFVISDKLGEIRVISCPVTETRISDKDFEYVINTVIFDAFRIGKYGEGIMNALDYLDQKIKR